MKKELVGEDLKTESKLTKMTKTLNLKVNREMLGSRYYFSSFAFLPGFMIFKNLNHQADFYFGEGKWLTEALDIKWVGNEVVFSMSVRSIE